MKISKKRHKMVCSGCYLSKENGAKLLEKLKSGFKGTVKSNKYRSQMTAQGNNNNLSYLTDPTFTKVNRLCFVIWKNWRKQC